MHKPKSLIRTALSRQLVLPIIGAVLLTVGAAGAVLWQTISHFALAEGQQFSNAGRQMLSISPDGMQIVYVANNNLYVKRMTEKDAHLLEGVSGAAAVTNPVFSPDGKYIAFWSGQDQTLKRVPVTGGTVQTICKAANPFGMSWASDDTILFGQGPAGIQRVRATGGTAETIITVKNGELAHGPQLLPGGNAVLYTLASSAANAGNRGIPPELESLINSNPQLLQGRGVADLLNLIGGSIWDSARIVVHSLKTNDAKTLIERGSDARYSPTGHLVYGLSGTLMSVRFDVERLEVTGSPVKLIEGIRNAGSTTGSNQFSFSSTGTLVYLSATASQPIQQRQFAFVDFTGNVTLLRHTPASIFGPRISPDGKQVAYRDSNAIWVADLFSEAPPRRLTTEPGEAPIWSPDGQRIAFISIFNNQEALYWRRSDGSGSAELLAPRARAPESWAADNQSFTYITLVGPSGDAGDYDIWSYSIRDKKESPLIVIPRSAQSGSRLSPDGKWIAYESNETGRAEVYVEPLSRNGQRFQVSKTGGSRPLWAPDMSKLYFDNNAGAAVRMLSATIKTQPAFSSEDIVTMPMKDFIQPSGTIRRQFDITPDGKQFLMMFQAVAASPQIDIIPNWFEQLKSR